LNVHAQHTLQVRHGRVIILDLHKLALLDGEDSAAVALMMGILHKDCQYLEAGLLVSNQVWNRVEILEVIVALDEVAHVDELRAMLLEVVVDLFDKLHALLCHLRASYFLDQRLDVTEA